MKTKSLSQDVIDRLLLAKDLLDKISSLPTADPDRLTIAHHILTAHDAAELALAGIAHHLGKLPESSQSFLMDYFSPIKETHPDEEVPGKSYFSQLNQVRKGIKHLGIFPNPKQWFRVGERTRSYVSIWCKKYLSILLDDLDESDMISDPDVKKQYDIAKKAIVEGDHKGCLENLALALHLLFKSNRALRNLKVGTPRAEDALKLSAFGVHANEFLTLQEFLPCAYSGTNGQVKINWWQEKFGHPANWRQDTAEFCLKTFVSVALRIQDAQGIPDALEFDLIYEHKITALVDNVEIVQEKSIGLLGATNKEVVHTLKKGESLRGKINKKNDYLDNSLMAIITGQTSKSVLSFIKFEAPIIFGEIEADKICVTCVPKDNEIVRKYFPNLPELKYN
jgi:hypothetical protein